MSDAFIIQGGSRLKGEVEVRGAKNLVLKAMAASILFDGSVEIRNVPLIEDVLRMSELLASLGVKKTEHPTSRNLLLNASEIKEFSFNNEIGKRFRASIVAAGPVLARTGQVKFPHPGGCLIGKRPIDVFLNGWRAMGAKIREKRKENGGTFEVFAKTLIGTDITLRVPSVTGTETMILTAVLAKGKTIIRNVAMEPEIPALAEFLNKSGANISGSGTPTIVIEGTAGKLLKATSPFHIIPDRIEAGSFLILGTALASSLKITNCIPDHLRSPIAILEDMGASIQIGENWIQTSRPKNLSSAEVKTREYPGFPTDLQAPLAVLLTQANGQSALFETIFEDRFGYTADLKRMGADIFVANPHRILINGPSQLRAREIESPDLRAGLAFVIAGLLAHGKTIVRNAHQIDRGYEKLEERLRNIGAPIERIKQN